MLRNALSLLWNAVIAGIFLLNLSLITAHAQSIERTVDDPIQSDLTQGGWIRDTDLLGIKIDRYRAPSGSIAIDLMAFPRTDKPASAWLDEFIPIMMGPDKKAGFKVHVINDDELRAKNSQSAMGQSGADVATRSVMVIRPGGKSKRTLMTVRAIVREGQPVQLSLLKLGETKASGEDNEHATRIRLEANMSVNNSAAFLGLESMISVMTEPLIYADKESLKTPQRSNSKSPRQVVASPTAPDRTSKAMPGSARSSGGRAPKFSPLPGPQVNVTGKYLGALPPGYRMEVNTTNYWTNKAMTATRSIYLTLTRDGQFEWANFSISGGMGGGLAGVSGTVHSNSKDGSAGGVFGSTNPSGRGTRSVALIKRDGLDASKYGTYYISGNQIEFGYANGKVETRTFKTDGYKTLLLNEKKFFNSTPDGWEKRAAGKARLYRSIDGAYRARSTLLDYKVSDGRKWMAEYLTKLRDNGLLESAGDIKYFKGNYGTYNVVKVAASVRLKKDKLAVKQELYLKFGSSKTRLIQIFRYDDKYDQQKILDFIKYLG